MILRLRKGIHRRCKSRSNYPDMTEYGYHGVRCEAPHGHDGDHQCWLGIHTQLRWPKTSWSTPKKVQA
jgi:hypothetical protein